MKTLEHQLADYGNRQRELHGPISAEELTVRLRGIDQTAPVQPLQPMPQPARFRRPQGWLVAVGAAAAVFVLAGATALLFRVTPSEAPVATVPPIDDVSSLTWSRVPHDEAVFGGPAGQWMASVTVGGPGFVAVGLEGPEDGPVDAVVWTSVDGVVWSRVPHDHAVFDRAQMGSVTAWGPGLVAVGGSDDGSDNWRGGAAVWTSVDGVVWSRVPHDESVFGGASMNSVTVGGPGLVAVGWDTTLDRDHADAAVWTSVDGLVWSRVPHDESVFGGDDRQVMYDVTAGGPGLVAVGADGDHPWDNSLGQDAAVWTSVDGIVCSPSLNNEKRLSDYP